MNFYYQFFLKSDKSDRLQLNSFSRIIDRLRVDFLGLWFRCHRLKQRFLQTSLFETTSCLGLEMNSSVETSKVHSGCDSHKKLGMQGWRPSYVNSETSAAFISVIIANSLVLPFSICLNVLVIIVVIKTPRLRNKYNTLLASLAGADILTGALGQPVFIIKQIYRLTTKMNCFIENNDLFFYVPPVIASTQLLTLMSIERYIAIKYPYNYHDIFTKHRLFGGILTAWFYALVVIQLNLIFPQNSSLRVSFSIFRILILILSLCMLVFCHVAVYHEAQKQIRKIRAQQLSTEAKETFLRENKALKTTRLVLGAALFTTLPHMFMRVVLSPRIGTSVMVFLLEAISLSIVFCNSLFNPLIYCIRNRQYRAAFKRVLRLRRNQVQSAGLSN